MNVKILVAHHKQSYLYEDDVFMPIHVGKFSSKIEIPIQGDDEGDNISHLNQYYCEMTAVYWAWKNLHDADYLGLCHYRRYPVKPSFWSILYLNFKYLIFFLSYKMHLGFTRDASFLRSIYNKRRISNILQKSSTFIKQNLMTNKVDVFVTNKYHFINKTAREHFSIVGQEYITKLEEIVLDYDPDFHKFLVDSLSHTFIYPANIFVMKKAIFEDYSIFIFEVLSRHFNYYKMTDNLKGYSRISGYMAELLTNAFINKLMTKEVKIKELQHLFVIE